MDELKRKIAAEKEKITTIQAPAALEFKLKKALAKQASRRKLTLPKWALIAASIFILLLIGYQHQALSYFGKKIFGYDALTNETLSQLLENEFGQSVEESITFADGNTLIVDAILSDENQFIVYLRLKNTGERSNFKELFEDDIFRVDELTAFLSTYDGHSSVSMIDKGANEIKMVATFNQVSPFAKEVSLKGSYDDAPFTLTFPYDASKALATGLKKRLKTKVVLDSEQLKFQQLIATPTMTLVKGTFEGSELYFDQIEFLVNGKELEQQGGAAKSRLFGKSFTIGFDALPDDAKTIAIAIEKYPAKQKIEKRFPLEAETSIMLADKEVIIDSVEKVAGKIEVTLTTEAKLRLKDVFIHVQNEKIALDHTENYGEKQKKAEKLETRTLIFEADALPDKIEIGAIEYLAPVHFWKEWKVK